MRLNNIGIFGKETIYNMKPFVLILLTASIMTLETKSQDQEALPFEKIPDSPKSYTSGNILARMIDGLGFRYYWATDGLTEMDLKYKPTEEARDLQQTLEHLYGLSLTIVNAPKNLPNERPADWSHLSVTEKRKRTLSNFEEASALFKSAEMEDLQNFQVVFKRGDQQYEFPLWNLINGPIADALWHTGQVVLMRRASGNPINPKVNVFAGKLND